MRTESRGSGVFEERDGALTVVESSSEKIGPGASRAGRS